MDTKSSKFEAVNAISNFVMKVAIKDFCTNYLLRHAAFWPRYS